MFDCILLVAGKSTRFSDSVNKILYKVNNVPVFKYSLDTFLSIKECKKIIIVTNLDSLNEVKDEIKNYDKDRIIITIGGKERQDSVYEGMKLVESEIVLIHDGARPMVKKEDIMNVYHETHLNRASVLAIKATDTIKEVTNLGVKTLKRENLWQVQTPQGLHSEDLKEAFIKAKDENFYGTDDVSLVEKYLDINPKMVVGDKNNIKVTTIEDVKYIEYLMGVK